MGKVNSMEGAYLVALILFPFMASTLNLQRGWISPNSSNHAKIPASPTIRSHGSKFVKARADGHLYLEDRLFDFRAFNAPTLLEGGDYQARDLLKSIAGFASPVTRTYPLRVANTMFGGYIPPSSGQIIGWNHLNDDWIYNETKWEQIDRALNYARDYGVKLIIPIINQNYGSAETNFIGNFNDLIRHRFGIKDYGTAQSLVEWFTDPEMLRVFKKLLTKFLNRINTVNNIRYGDDETILAIETCNEANWGMYNYTVFIRPPPAHWTLSVARHIKSLAPHILVMDGSFARNISLPSVWEEDVLKSPDVDLFSYHLYGDSQIDNFPVLKQTIRRYGKALIIGEHGFYSESSLYRAAHRLFDCAGTLIWSLTAHADKGGFVTHSEGSNIFSYHIPGWKVQTAPDFDTQEYEVVHSTYEASFAALNVHLPPFPIPGAPDPFFISNGSHPGISWRGSAWAYRYEIYGAHARGFVFDLVAQSLNDNAGEGGIFLPVDPHKPTDKIVVRKLPSQPLRSHTGWVDTKWPHHLAHIPKIVPRSAPFGYQPNLFELSPNLPDSQMNDIDSPLLPHIGTPEGGWWRIRGVSVDGVPGPFSKPIYLSRFWNSGPQKNQ